jgi:hypothetical protein
MAVSHSVLENYERYWADLQPFLLQYDYQLRPRYRPEWKPSWFQPGNRARWFNCEDSIRMPVSMIVWSVVYLPVAIADCCFYVLSRNLGLWMLLGSWMGPRLY